MSADGRPPLRSPGRASVRSGGGTPTPSRSRSARGPSAILALDAIVLAVVLATAPAAFIWLGGSAPAAVAFASPQPSASIEAAPSPTTASAVPTATPATPAASSVSPTAVVDRLGAWSLLVPLPVPLWGPGVALLTDGRMLVIGGVSGSSSFNALSDVEAFDPRLGSWAAVEPMLVARAYPTTAVLPDGSVLVAGGSRNGLPLAGAERYVPGTGTWVSAGTMNVPRSHATATVLQDGRVLVTGGGWQGSPGYASTATAEIFDPATNAWTATAPMTHARAWHTATLLPDGSVLVVGGADTYHGTKGKVTATAETYDPVSATWRPAKSMSVARYHQTAAPLPDGRVLVAGGWALTSNSDRSLASAAIYDPASDTWTATGAMAAGRASASMVVLPDGRALVVGGVDPAYRVMATTEIFDVETGRWRTTGRLGTPVMMPALAVLEDGRVVLAGGALDTNASRPTSIATIFLPPKP